MVMRIAEYWVANSILLSFFSFCFLCCREWLIAAIIRCWPESCMHPPFLWTSLCIPFPFLPIMGRAILLVLILSHSGCFPGLTAFWSTSNDGSCPHSKQARVCEAVFRARYTVEGICYLGYFTLPLWKHGNLQCLLREAAEGVAGREGACRHLQNAKDPAASCIPGAERTAGRFHTTAVSKAEEPWETASPHSCAPEQGTMHFYASNPLNLP